jgi:polyhydroxyalkanoate synthesis regulator phasin
MSEINDLVDNFGLDGYVSPEDAKTVADVVKLLVTKIETLEQDIIALQNK